MDVQGRGEPVADRDHHLHRLLHSTDREFLPPTNTRALHNRLPNFYTAELMRVGFYIFVTICYLGPTQGAAGLNNVEIS